MIYQDDISGRYSKGTPGPGRALEGGLSEATVAALSVVRAAGVGCRGPSPRRRGASGTEVGGARAYDSLMVFSGRSFDPTSPPRASSGPAVDYTLARRAAIASLRRGALGTHDVCDAHPELMRAAKNIGESIDRRCPVCSHETLRLVRYVYGSELKRNSGRVVYPAEWLDEISLAYDNFTCYVVEVCVDCAWNHLLCSYLAGKRYVREQAPERKRL